MENKHERNMISYHMSHLNDKKKCTTHSGYGLMQIDGLKSYFKDDDYILSLIDAFYLSGYKKSEYNNLRNAIKNKGLL